MTHLLMNKRMTLQVNSMGGISLGNLSLREKAYIVLAINSSDSRNVKHTSHPFTKSTHPEFGSLQVEFPVDLNLIQTFDIKVLAVSQEALIGEVSISTLDMFARTPLDVSRSLQLLQLPLWKDHKDFHIYYTFIPDTTVVPGFTDLSYQNLVNPPRATLTEVDPVLLGWSHGNPDLSAPAQGTEMILELGEVQMSDHAAGSGPSESSHGNGHMLGGPIAGHGYVHEYQDHGYQPQHAGYQLMQPQDPRPRRQRFGVLRMGLRSLVAHVGAILCGNAISDEAGFDDVDAI